MKLNFGGWNTFMWTWKFFPIFQRAKSEPCKKSTKIIFNRILMLFKKPLVIDVLISVDVPAIILKCNTDFVIRLQKLLKLSSRNQFIAGKGIAPRLATYSRFSPFERKHQSKNTKIRQLLSNTKLSKNNFFSPKKE